MMSSNTTSNQPRRKRTRISAFSASSLSDNLPKGMAKRDSQKRNTVGFAAAGERTTNSESLREQGDFEVSHVTTLERPDLLILFGLAVVTFGIYAQLIGHRFITIDDLSYIEENPMVNRGVTLGG